MVYFLNQCMYVYMYIYIYIYIYIKNIIEYFVITLRYQVFNFTLLLFFNVIMTMCVTGHMRFKYTG